MKLIRRSQGQCVFHLRGHEKMLLFDLLRRYPLTPAGGERQRFSRQAGGSARDRETQRLLDEALKEQRRQNRRQVRAMLEHQVQFKADGSGCSMTLTASQIDWLTQVLNDLRIGGWLQLGSPDPLPPDPAKLPKPVQEAFMVMEAAGYFEMRLLEAWDDAPGRSATDS